VDKRVDWLLETLDRLAELLDTEYAAIMSGDLQSLQAINELKASTFDELSSVGAVDVSQGVSSGEDGCVEWFQDDRISGKLTWCRGLNERNGRLIGERMSYIRRALPVLCGVRQEGRYSQSGKVY